MRGWQRRVEEILDEHTSLVLADSTLDAILAHLARGAAELGECAPERSFIRVVDPASAIGMQDVWAKEPGEGRDVAFAGAISAAIQERGPQQITELSVRVGEQLEPALIVPLIGREACHGYLCLGSTLPRHAAPRQRPLIEALAHQALQSIYSETIRSRAALVGAVEAASLTHEPLLAYLQKIADKAARQTRIKDVIVEILGLSENRDALVTLAVAGRLRDAKQEVLPGYFAAAITEAWQAVVNDGVHYRASIEPGNDAMGNQPESKRAVVSTSVAGSRTVLAIPLRDAQGVMLGVLNVEARAPRTLARMESLLQPLVTRAEAALQRAGAAPRAAATSLRSVLPRIGSHVPNLLDPRRKNLRALYQAILRRAVQMISDTEIKAAIAFCGEKVFTITPDAMFGYTSELIQVWSWSEEQGLTGIARRTRRSVRVPDVHSPDAAEIYVEQDPSAVSEMVVPLLHGKEVVGVFDFVSPRPSVFTQKHQELIEAFARQVVQTLARARDIGSLWLAWEDRKLIQETSEGIERMLRVQNGSAIHQVRDSSKLREAREKLLAELLTKAATYTRSAYGAILAAVRLPQRRDDAEGTESTELVELTWYGPRSHPHITHLPGVEHSSKIAAKAFNENRVQNFSPIEDAGSDEALFGASVKSALAVPIPGGDRVMGVLCLESNVRKLYSPAHEKRVAMFASQAANVISSANLSLYRLKMHRLLNLVDDVMTKSLAPEADGPLHPQIREHILKTALDLTEQQGDGSASLWLMRNGKLKYETSIPESARRTHSQPGIVRRALEQGGPIIVLDAEEAAAKRGLPRSDAWTQSELAVPLLDPDRRSEEPGRVLGVIHVRSPRTAAFNGREVEILELLARIMVTSMRLTEMHNDRIDFLADVSHGLRPLSSAVGFHVAHLQRLGIAGFDTAESETHATFEQLERGIETLSTFIECAATLTRHEKLGESIPMEEVSLLTLAGDMAQALQFYAQRSQRRVEIDPESRDVTIKCAKHLVRVAVFALIENAIEHGAEDDVILVGVHRRPGNCARIEVIDHGDPILPEQRKLLFSRRYGRPRPLARRDANGSDGAGVAEHGRTLGIGLDHVWRIVHEVHGGEAKYRHDKRGKVFYLNLPGGTGEQV